ncbi:MAG: RND family transporter [Candidatus Cloacimonetes bacterium]|nr:RND family transporter [Candidatus Cloacimonadota bacterium]
MRKFAELVLKYRVPIIIGTVIITVFMAFQLRKLEINSDILEYLPQDDPNVVLFNEVGDKFGGNSLAMIALEKDDIFNPNTLNRINTITQKFKEMPEISYVISLTDVIDIKKMEDGLEVGKLVDERHIPSEKNELERIKNYTLSKEMYRGNIVSDDGTIAVIIARLRKDVDRIAVGREMKEFVLSTKGNEKLYFAGIPFQMIFLIDVINSDIIKLLPVVILLLIITLAISFRSKRGVILPLATVIISTTWGLGLMSLFGIKLTIASDGMPILLLAIGSAYGIHLVNKYLEDIRKGDNKIEAIKDTISEVGIPIFLAGLTTAIGFLAFLVSNLTIIKEFGIFTAIGVLFAFIVSITFLPALLSFMSPPKIRKNQKYIQLASTNRFMKRLSGVIIKRKVGIVLVGFFICAIGIFSIFNISREVNMVDYFKKDSEIREAEDMMESKLGGSIPIQILVKGDLQEPAVLKEMIKLEKCLKSLPDVHSPQSIADLICEMNDVMNDSYCIPETREGVANLWFFLEGNEILPQLINSHNNEGLIQAKLGTVNTKKANLITGQIDRFISENINSDILMIDLTEANSNINEINLERVENISNKIFYDAVHYGFEIKDRDALEDILHKYLTQDYQEIPTSSLTAKLVDYMNDEDSDLLIENSSMRNNIAKSLIRYFEKNYDYSEKGIVSNLKKVVPNSYYEDDPEMLDYAAMSIKSIINNEIEWNKVNNLMKEIAPLLSKDIQQNSDFHKNLIGDVWEINDTKIFLSNSKFKNLNKDDQHSTIPLDLQQTGMPIIYKDIDNNIVSSQTYSLIFAIGLVLILLAIQFRSFIGGLISILPIILTVLFNFTIMWIFKIPLDAATVMIGSVAVGIGIDYTIHFNNRFHFEIGKKNSVENALDTTLQTTGKGIIINAFSVMVGFLTLLLGSIVPMQRFGWLIALTMVISATASITFLPSLLLITHASFIGDLKHLALRRAINIKANIKQKVNNFKEKK